LGPVAPILWIGIIFGFSLTVDPSGGIDPWFVKLVSPLVHATEFLLLAVLLSAIRTKWFSWKTVLAIGLLIAFMDEFLIQAMTPERVSDLWDVAADAFGLLVGVALAPHVRRLTPLIEWGSVLIAGLILFRFFT